MPHTALPTRVSRLTAAFAALLVLATWVALFAVLRVFDDAAVKLIWVETPPDTLEWEGVRDRLQRASA